MIRHRRLALWTLLASGWFLLAPSIIPAAEKEAAEKTIELKKGDRILFFGDSLTQLGIGPKGYVSIVRNTLKEKYPDLGLEVLSVATGGHRVPDLLARMDKDVTPKKATIVSIQIGVNDAGRGHTKQQFKAGLEELIQRLQKAGAQVILCSLTSLGEKHDGTNRIDEKLDEFADVARHVAQEQKVPLNDLRKAFKEYWKKNNPRNLDKGILTYDGNHFNDTGHQFVAEQMLKKLTVPGSGR